MMSPATTFQRTDFLRFLLGSAFFAMVGLVIVQELFGAATTWLVIRLARDILDEHVTATDFVAIVVTQTLSYVAGAISWIYAERCGFGAFGKYMLHFAGSNRFQTALLGDSKAREQTEPFLTGETFRVCFDLMYDLQFYLRLFFNLVFNAAVLGMEIDAGLPVAYAGAFVLLVFLQWCLRKPLAGAYLHNQRMTNRMTARTYNAWDNIFTGNRYNFFLWHRDFRERLQMALSAQIRAILAREGWSAVSGIIALVIVLATTAWVAVNDAGDMALLIALAATLPRQIEMTLDMHQLTAGMTDLMAIWTRIKGICEHMQPAPAGDFGERIEFGRLALRVGEREIVCASLPDAAAAILAAPTGLVAVRGGNGAGKSTLLAALKAYFRGRAYYLPAHDRLSYQFNTGQPVPPEPVAAEPDEEAEEAEAICAEEMARESSGYSSGERQLQVLREVVAGTDRPIYLLDEWDANLDAANRARAMALVGQLAARARVVEISHRDAA
jgi:ABC-type transport system involved in cytochrome bd biosynthesis fused ATPase/permease subunit